MAISSEIFGSHVFDFKTMKKRLPKATFKALSHSIENGTKLSLEHANAVAHVMMEWAIGMGATHYTHLFQPLTGLTAQKHDAFFSLDSQLGAIERFSGSDLIQGEPDASSFPSGGTRTTFEARGYTAWDLSSPVFLMINGDVRVLTIPSVFFSYTGHALDKKTPLLRSVRSLNEAASKALKLLGRGDLKVHSTIGVEQEYFLIDKAFYEKRPDLIMAGRTVLGTPPAKGQQMEDHYFGSIKDRVLSFMEELETRLYRLGVPCKTRHNEVAPHQYETAPIYEDANLAADHNQLVMEMLRKLSAEKGMVALLHEKPFAEVNGSGKHVNWSMEASDGSNLLEPGTEPHRNMQFLYFLVAVVNAIHKRGGILRSTIASSGNDHRLGANEAPPAIMSVFLGSHLNKVLEQIEIAKDMSPEQVASIDLGLSQLPDIKVDNTDRNRTSPFAFTGMKFEFRAVGSNQSISMPAAMLNAAVSESLTEMNGELEKLKNPTDEKELLQLLRSFIKRSKPIRFEGNNYSDEWAREAESRGLPNLKTTPEALSAWQDQSNRDFMKATGLFTEQEMDAHYSVRLEQYSHTMGIEANVAISMIHRHVLPSCFRYQTELANALASLKSVGIDGDRCKQQRGLLEELNGLIGNLIESTSELNHAVERTEEIGDMAEQAAAWATTVKDLMNQARGYCDNLEKLVDAQAWNLPSYQELLFIM